MRWLPAPLRPLSRTSKRTPPKRNGRGWRKLWVVASMKRTHFEFSRVAVNVLWRCANQELKLGTSAPRFGINSPRQSDLPTVIYPYDELVSTSEEHDISGHARPRSHLSELWAVIKPPAARSFPRSGRASGTPMLGVRSVWRSRARRTGHLYHAAAPRLLERNRLLIVIERHWPQKRTVNATSAHVRRAPTPSPRRASPRPCPMSRSGSGNGRASHRKPLS